MKTRMLSGYAALGLLSAGAVAQSVVFDFDTAPLHAPLPISLTAGGITATFSATGQGFSIQEANTMGFTPAGFSGRCLYPSSVFAADLQVDFSTSVSDFSVLYAPQELACDSSARMKVTAYRNGALVGTNTATADPPGTWPSATLAFSAPRGFNRVVVHYDAPPPTGGDWGPIFMADNMAVTAGPPGLRIFPTSTDSVVLAWAASATGFALQGNAYLATTGWSGVTNTVNVVGDENQVVLLPSAAGQFYRLFRP